MKRKTSVWTGVSSCHLLKGPGRSGIGIGSGWRKNRVRKNLAWPDWPSKTRWKTRLQPVDFSFFTKTTLFWFKKKLTRSKLRTRVLNQTGHQIGSENYALAISILQIEGGREQINNNKSNKSHKTNK